MVEKEVKKEIVFHNRLMSNLSLKKLNIDSDGSSSGDFNVF